MDKIILSQIDIAELLDKFRGVVREEIKADKQNQHEEKFLSVDETCKMFSPAISRPTLAAWSAAGHLQKHLIGTKPFYKMSEVLEAGKCLKRYKIPSSSKD